MNKNTATPFFSVIIPTYNRFAFLKIAINSVLGQSFKNFQLIIADDGSSDPTRQLAKTYKNSRLEYYYQKNRGPAAARNLGISKAKGKYICFLDSDDRFRNDKLEVTYACIKKNPQYRIFHSQEIWYRKGRFLAQKKCHQKPNGFVFEKALRLCSISISTAVLKKSVFKAIGLFDPNLKACEDYDFWLRATLRYPVYLIPEFLTIKEGGHLRQQSKKYPALDKFRIYALKKILDNEPLGNQKYQMVYRELKRKSLIYIKGAEKRKNFKEAQKYRRLLEKYKKHE